MDKNNFIMSFTIDKDFASDQFLKLRLRVCHDGESPNKTYFTKETMAEANKSLEYIPILAHTYVDEETGKPVIGSHDMHIEEDKLNEGNSRVIYDEIPIGVIPSLADNNCTIEEYDGRNHTYVDGYIWRDYANYAEQLIEDAENNKISMEIDFSDESLSYDAANERYNIASYRYRGITVLNEKLGTGMMNALATTTNFSANEDIKSKMIVLMEELQKCLREYNTEDSEEGGNVAMDNNEEIVDTTVEDAVVETTEETTDVTEETPIDDVVAEETVFTNEPAAEEAPAVEGFSANEPEPLVCTFRISHDDTRYALQNLLNSMCNEGQFLYIESVYDGYFYYADYFTGDAYKQSYKVRKDVVSFSGDPERVYREFVTQAEKDELENMRKSYAELKAFKEEVEAKELKAQKDAVFAKAEYECLADDEAFKQLKADADNYSVEELSTKADLCFAAHVKAAGTFSAKVEEKKAPKTIGVSFEKKEKSKKPYGNLFDDKK
jgi:hypothetical protein